MCGDKVWTEVTLPWVSTGNINSLWSAPGSSVLWGGGGFGSSNLFWLQGDTWSRPPQGLAGSINAFGGSSDANTWAVGSNGFIIRRNAANTGWETGPGASTFNNLKLNDVWSFSPNDTWVVANSYSAAYHWNGGYWENYEFGDDTCNGLWASSPSNVWAVCGGGQTFRWNGSAWAEASTPVSATLLAIHGFSSSRMFAVGTLNTILSWSGSSWTYMEPPTAPGFGSQYSAVWGRAPDDVWAVGSDGQIAHFDGNVWTEVESGTTEHLKAVWGVDGRVFAAGDGILLEYGAQ